MWFLVVLRCLGFSILVDPMRPFSWMSSCTKFQVLVQLGVEKLTLFDELAKKDGKWESHCWKIVGSLSRYGVFSKFNQQYMLGCRRAYFDVSRHKYPHVFLKNPPMEFFPKFPLPPKSLRHMEMLGAPKLWLTRIWVPNTYLQLYLLQSKACTTLKSVQSL